MPNNQLNQQPVFVKRPDVFNNLDVGRDASMSLRDHNGDGDFDLFVAHTNGFNYYENVEGEFVLQPLSNNPMRDLENGRATKLAFVPKNETEDYLIVSDSDGNIAYELDAVNNRYRELQGTETPLNRLPSSDENFLFSQNAIFASENPNDPLNRPAIGFISYLTGDVSFFIGEKNAAGNYIYQMVPNLSGDNIFSQFNGDVDDSANHNLRQGPEFTGIGIDGPVYFDIYVGTGRTRITGATQFSVGGELYQAIGHTRFNYYDITFYKWNASDTDWEYMSDAHEIFFGSDLTFGEELGSEITLDSVDFDGDGDEDLIVGNAGGVIQYFENTGASPDSVRDRGTTPTLPLDKVDDYIASHPDLMSAFGYNLEAAQNHYLQFGAQEGRAIDTFAEDIYLASNPDLIPVFGSHNLEAAIRHYIESGYAEGRNINLFDPERYLRAYSDLQAAFGDDLAAATRHYIESGYIEGRDPLLGFDFAAYIASHDDLVINLGYNPEAARQHYIQFGAREGRTISFQADHYIASHGDLIETFRYDLDAGIEHFIRMGMAEGRARDTFDEAAYLAQYGDLQAAFGTDYKAATQHYINHGFFEGRTFG